MKLCTAIERGLEEVDQPKGLAARGLNRACDAASEQIAEVVEEGVRATRRAMTEGRHLAEDLRDLTVLGVRRHPWRALGFAMVVGLGIGSFAGGSAVAAFGRDRVTRR